MSFHGAYRLMDTTESGATSPLNASSLLPQTQLGGLNKEDLYLFNEGRQFRLHQHLGAHPGSVGGVPGTRFAVWAPHAASVSVIGDFNGWNRVAHPLTHLGASGVWAGFIPGVGPGANYKYHIVSHNSGYAVDKADPISFRMECPPRTASVVWDLSFKWNDSSWLAERGQRQKLDAPWSIYEVHLGSWMRSPDDPGHVLGYRELAPRLVEYVRNLGFTHIELLPIMEHPFYGSWGYQVTGFFAPTSRHGTPQDFMFLIDSLHQAGIGVILDWVPSHFPSDEHGLAYFDGTHLYEHADPRQGHHPDWNSCIFNYGRHEVRSFLISSALFWLETFHIDALRVDAVASMLYLDYSRREGEWIPNQFGGRENLEAIDFLRQLNQEVYLSFPDTQTIAEESTSWPKVTRPVWDGGLGFGFKWDMGWMHDSLSHIQRDPVHRRWHHRELTFRGLYQNSENFVLPLSHDEVVHMKGSLFGKMFGDHPSKFAQLRLLFGWQFGQAGKKLVFMGDEWGQCGEWQHERSLDWHETRDSSHAGVLRWVGHLAAFMRSEPALHEGDCEPWGSWWIEPDDCDNGLIIFARRDRADNSVVVVACNFTPIPHSGWRIGFPWAGPWQERLNSDSLEYGGTGMSNNGGIQAEPMPWQGQAASAEVNLPPFSVVFFHAAKNPVAKGSR